MFRLLLLLICLSTSTLCAQSIPKTFEVPIPFEQREIPVYTLPDSTQDYMVLQFDYAQSDIANPDAFDSTYSAWVDTIELVFTRYPWNFSDWRTDYGLLLTKRMEELYLLDSTLFQRDEIIWRYTLQTDCQSEAEAKVRFHGLILHYTPRSDSVASDSLSASIPPPPTRAHRELVPPSDKLMALARKEPDLMKIARVVYKTKEPLKDSTLYRVLNRNTKWDDMLVVMDWTASMYRNGASIVRWYREHPGRERIKHMVLFNDGDRKHHKHKVIGKTGGIYYTKPNDIESVLVKMLRVKQAGTGGDPEENDIEAILIGTGRLKGFKEVILIPDRKSSIRDISLLKHIRGPVRIVLFNIQEISSASWGKQVKPAVDKWIHPHYLSLASITGGSVHTYEDDITHLSKMKAGERFQYGRYIYEKRENGSFKVVER